MYHINFKMVFNLIPLRVKTRGVGEKGRGKERKSGKEGEGRRKDGVDILNYHGKACNDDIPSPWIC